MELAWQSRLKQEFESSDYEVFFPQLPDCHTPNLATYDSFLRESGWDFTDNVLVGHSSGATTALHLLQQDWFPRQKAVALVGVFLNEQLVKTASWYEPGQFDELFVEAFEPDQLRRKAGQFYFVHGDDDPYCDYTEAKQLCDKLGGKFITMPGAGHIGSSANVPQLTALERALRQDGVLERES